MKSPFKLLKDADIMSSEAAFEYGAGGLAQPSIYTTK